MSIANLTYGFAAIKHLILPEFAGTDRNGFDAVI